MSAPALRKHKKVTYSIAALSAVSVGETPAGRDGARIAAALKREETVSALYRVTPRQPYKAPTPAQLKAAKAAPTYARMVLEAVSAETKGGNQYTAASTYAIVAYIERKWPGKAVRHQIRAAIKKLLAGKSLVQRRASYRLAPGTAVVPKKKAKKVAVAPKKKKKSPAKQQKKKGGKAKSPAKRKAAAKKKAPAAAAKKKTAGVARAPKRVGAGARPKKAAAAAALKARAGGGGGGASAAGERPAARVFDTSTKAKPARGIVWQYQHGGWQNYDQKASDVVEAAYQDFMKNPYTDVRAVASGSFQYEIDFQQMTQTNIQHPAHTSRQIRRHML